MDLSGIDLDRVPSHIGCIMDGNGRWAAKRGLPRTEGHAQGEHALFDTLEGALELGIEWFTVYAFSTENWKRPKEEVRFLLNFNQEILDRRAEDLHERDVRIRFIGRNNWRVPKRLVRRMDEAAEKTRFNKTMTFTIAFNYGGRAEIVDAVRALVSEGVEANKITEAAIAKRLYDHSMPDPDLLIRTSGENRLSNFLTWQSAYSELYFTDVLWPEFGRDQLADAVREYQHRERRFGAV
ncbi:MAG: di-trans,poly-cis-decaprenylcistransferase [Acidobacteria bacterium]|nr:di-trans,poly-cis-decaprenylcistransferase [Acidobacteriota bacterium]